MRAMNLPQYLAEDVYKSCVDGISNVALKIRMLEISDDLALASTDYVARAKIANLFSYPISNLKNDEIIIKRVSKSEVKDLYSYYMVDKNMPARMIYNTLVASAENGVCPLCGVGHATTLDHYLPKGKYPLFSVLPQNLVPACRDCNIGKSSVSATTIGSQSFHPYYDHKNFIGDQWLFAEVVQATPPTVRYYVNAPDNWSFSDKERANSHFNLLNLGVRFSVLAASELSSLRALLIDYVAPAGADAIKEHLHSRALSEYKTHVNSWKSAMFQALSNNEWYCKEGFSLI